MRRSIIRILRPRESYDNFVNMGILKQDPHQILALSQIDRLYDDLTKYYMSGTSKPRVKQITPPKRLGLTPVNVIQARAVTDYRKAQGLISHTHPLSSVRGVYLYGGVGCGKTHLMDILFNEAPTVHKKRVHFHQFMLDVHKTMHNIRKAGKSLEHDDMMDEVSIRMLDGAELLCFDEMLVNDIADAMILKRLFTAFYKHGLCACFTSNRHPDELYKNGINRESFTPFIDLLKEQNVIHFIESTTDYRLMGKLAETYLFPIDDTNRSKFDSMFMTLTKMEMARPRILSVFGRDVVIDRAVQGVCRLNFREVCTTDSMSVADYGIIAKTFHTVFIEDIPQMNPVSEGNTVRRFISLIDELYQHNCKVIMLAASPPDQLQLSAGPMVSGDGVLSNEQVAAMASVAHEEMFQMDRCVSRIMEMRTERYMQQPHKGQELTLADRF